jgi:hypothetical protein
VPTWFFNHYQLCRNVSYADPDPIREATVIFLVPAANRALKAGWEQLAGYLLKDVECAVRLVFIEDLIDRLRKKSHGMSPRIAQHVEEFAAKYLVPAA